MGVVLTPPSRIQEPNRASLSLGPSRGTLRPREVQESAQGHTARQGQKCREGAGELAWGWIRAHGVAVRGEPAAHGCRQGGHPHPGGSRTVARGGLSQGALRGLLQPRDWRSAGNRTLRGRLWPSRGGGAPALPGEGDQRGQSSQDRAGQTRGPWTRRCPTQLRVNRLVLEEAPPDVPFSHFRWSADQSESTCTPRCVHVSGACAAAGFR